MVRLKVFSEIKTTIVTVISIPYGAIKRVNDEIEKTTVVAFQFLMVRLKVRAGALKYRLTLHFNSLWCD